jgi:hypothetical protein
MKKALLILIGGRQTANILTALYLQPDVIVPVASHEALRDGDSWSQVKETLMRICPDGVEDPSEVDAFDIEQIRSVCNMAVERHPDAEWLFNLTCGSKIMGFGAFDVAKAAGAAAWYLDTITRRVVTLSGKAPDKELFQLKVVEYLAGYGRTCSIPAEPNARLLNFAKQLAQRPRDAMRFRDSLRNCGFGQNKASEHMTAPLSAQARYVHHICRNAKTAGLLKDFHIKGQGVEITVEGNNLFRFLDGGWFETFVYSAAIEAQCFDDVKCNLETPGLSGINNLDLAATHAASFIIAECKTENKLETDHLDKLSSIAALMGGNYVGRMFITSKTINPHDVREVQAYKAFLAQAQSRKVVVVTGDQLSDLPRLFQQEVRSPTYPRE